MLYLIGAIHPTALRTHRVYKIDSDSYELGRRLLEEVSKISGKIIAKKHWWVIILKSNADEVLNVGKKS